MVHSSRTNPHCSLSVWLHGAAQHMVTACQWLHASTPRKLMCSEMVRARRREMGRSGTFSSTRLSGPHSVWVTGRLKEDAACRQEVEGCERTGEGEAEQKSAY